MGDFIYEKTGYILDLPINNTNATNITNSTNKEGISNYDKSILICLVFVFALIIYNLNVIVLFIRNPNFNNSNNSNINTQNIGDEENIRRSPIHFNIEFDLNTTRRSSIDVEYNPIRDIIENINMLRVEYNNSYDDYNENINKILNCNNFGEYIDDIDENDNCPICISVNNIDSIKLNNCSHIFHDNCIKEHIISKCKINQIPTCPMCRTPIY